jgi:hypothetical protein
LYIPNIIIFGIEIDDLESDHMAGLDMSTAVDCTVRAFTDNFEFLDVSTGPRRAPIFKYVYAKQKIAVCSSSDAYGLQYIPRRYDRDSHPSVDWRLS